MGGRTPDPEFYCSYCDGHSYTLRCPECGHTAYAMPPAEALALRDGGSWGRPPLNADEGSGMQIENPNQPGGEKL